MPRRASASLRAAVSVCLLSACGPGADENRAPRQVILVTIDTLRADRLGCYGWEGETSPRIDALAEESILFRNATSQAPWTTGSFASLFTGRLTSEALASGDQLNPGLDTLAEILAGEGLVTVAVVANPNLNRESGFARGFDRYVELGRKSEDDSRPSDSSRGARPVRMDKRATKVGADEVTDTVLALLDELGDRDFFLWVLYLDPHSPYFRHAARHYRGAERFEETVAEGERVVVPPAPLLVRTDAGEERYVLPRPGGRTEGDRNDPEAGIRAVRYLYDGEVRFVDEHVGRLLDSVRARGHLEHALLVLTSDHGEALFDHDHYYGHGPHTHQGEVHVPLIVRWPGEPAGEVTAPVALVDLRPTILGFLGAPDSGFARGVALGTRGRGGVAPILTEAHQGRSRALREGPWKVVAGKREGKPWLRLHDIARDPAEKSDLSGRKPKLALELSRKMEKLVQEFELAPQDLPRPQLDGGTEEALRALGYAR